MARVAKMQETKGVWSGIRSREFKYVSGSWVQPVAMSSNRLSNSVGGLDSPLLSSGCCLLTGACPGLPHAAALGARDVGGHIVGISPASGLKEHVETFGSPYKEYDELIFTGLGLMGREIVNIRSSDIVVVVGGRSGTLGEFAIAYEEGKLIGVLTGTGGITSVLPALEKSLGKTTGAKVIYTPNPENLVDQLLKHYLSSGYVNPCHPSSVVGSDR